MPQVFPLSPNLRSNPMGLVNFGWAPQGHATINQKAIQELPDNSWKQFLIKHLPQINTYNDFQDHFHQNSYHSIILDPKTLTFSESKNYGQTVKNPGPDAWERIQAQYSAENHQTFLNSVQTAYPKVIPGRHAIFAAQHMFGSIVAILKQANNNFSHPQTGRTIPPEGREPLKHHLLDRIGVLTHLVADMVNPLHTSNPHNWPLGKESKWGAHHFLEHSFFKSPEDYRLEGAKYPLDNYRPLKDRDAIETYLCKYVSRAAEKVFHIVKCQQEALRQHPETGAGLTKDYEETLTKCYKPLMQDQAYSASKILSRILHTAWVHAGKPDLSKLEAAAVENQKRRMSDKAPGN